MRPRSFEDTKPLRFTRFAYLCARVTLIYAQRHALPVSRLSMNVVRQVSSYLWFRPKLLVPYSTRLWSFDPETYCWTEECQPSLYSQNQSIGFVIYCGENEAFIQASRYSRQIAFILRDDQLTSVCPLYRRHYGAIFDAARMRICFFGGVVDGNQSKAGDQLLLRTETWRKLPDMNRAKMKFVPCWFRDKAYLCYDHVEEFDPQTDAFSLLLVSSFPLTFRSCSNVAVPDRDGIAIIYHGVIASWRPGMTAMEATCSFPDKSELLSRQVVSGQWVYFRDRTSGVLSCCALNIHDGKIQSLAGKLRILLRDQTSRSL